MKEIRNEKIRLTDKDLYPKLVELLESMGESIYHGTAKYNGMRDAIGFDGKDWISFEGETNISDVDFLAKYAHPVAAKKHLPEKTAVQCQSEEEYQKVLDVLGLVLPMTMQDDGNFKQVGIQFNDFEVLIDDVMKP